MAVKSQVTDLSAKLRFLEGFGVVDDIQESREAKVVAKLIGVSPQTYSGYKKQNSMPPNRQRALAAAFTFNANSEIWLAGSSASFREKYLAPPTPAIAADRSREFDDQSPRSTRYAAESPPINNGREAQVSPTLIVRDWGQSMSIPHFIGRVKEITTLSNWVTEGDCRLILIYGMLGIGKSALALQVVKEVADGSRATDSPEFPIVIWRSLVNQPHYQDFVSDLINTISPYRDVSRSTPEEVRKNLGDELARRRCLIVLDNFESVLPRPNSALDTLDQAYLFSQLIDFVSRSSHRSTIIMTSSEKPVQLTPIEGERREVRSLELRGLGVSEVKSIFESVGTFQGGTRDWEQIVTDYDGNPLLMDTVARDILLLFGGSLRSYLDAGYTMPASFLSRMDQHFDRLDSDERTVIYWLAIERGPVEILDLAADLRSTALRRKLASVLISIARKIRLERIEGKFFLVPAVLAYVTDRLVREVSENILKRQIGPLDEVALMKATSKDHIREVQSNLIVRVIVSELEAQLGTKERADGHLRRLIEECVTQPDRYPGYAVGNLINLFNSLNGGIIDLDLHGTVIRQAYLRDTEVRDVDFSNCEFTEVSLTEAIGGLVSVAYQPDGQRFATGDMSGFLHIWETVSGKKIRTIGLHQGWVRSVAFSPDGRFVASAGEDSVVQIWDVDNFEKVRIFNYTQGRALSLAFSTQNNNIAFAGDDEKVYICSVETGAIVAQLTGDTAPVWAVAFNKDGTLLATGSEGGVIKVWRVREDSAVCEVTVILGSVRCLAFAASGSVLGVGTEEGGVFIIDLTDEAIPFELGRHTDAVRSLNFSPEDHCLATGDRGGTIAVWNWRVNQRMKVFGRGNRCVRSLAFHPSRPMLLTCTDDGYRIWDWTTAESISSCTRVLNSVWKISGSRLQSELVAGYEDGTIRKWDLEHGREITVLALHEDRVRALAVCEPAKFLASGGSDRHVFILGTQLDKGGIRRILDEISWIRSLAFNLDGTLLVCVGGSPLIRIWDTETLTSLAALENPDGLIQAVRFSPDGKRFITGSVSGNLRIRMTANTQEEHLLSLGGEAITSLAILSEPDTVFAATEEGTIGAWDLSTGSLLASWAAHKGRIIDIATSIAQNRLVSVGEDGTIRLWNVNDRRSPFIITELDEGGVSATSLSFVQDSTVAIGFIDGAIMLWQPDTGIYARKVQTRMPYSNTRIRAVTGVTEDQKRSLKLLGAIDGPSPEAPLLEGRP
jgi:WD40 repeat protein